MSNQTEYARQLREHLEDGLGWNDLTKEQRRSLAAKYFMDKADEDLRGDLIVSEGCMDALTLMAFRLAGSGQDYQNRALEAMGDCWAHELADLIKSDFDKALEQMREDLAEDRGQGL
jgi:hypothetical protein